MFVVTGLQSPSSPGAFRLIEIHILSPEPWLVHESERNLFEKMKYHNPCSSRSAALKLANV
jgi:hypothetical protein